MIHSIGPISIAIAPVEEASRQSRRQAERAAVARCIDELREADSAMPPYDSIEHDSHGAPLLPGWQISITHSRAVAAVAISREGASTPFGIDAEEWRPTLLRVATRYLSPAEMALTTGGADLSHAAQARLLRLWTIKEAVYKAAGAPGLPFTAIETDSTLTRAQAAGNAYALRSIPHPSATITLAIRL